MHYRGMEFGGAHVWKTSHPQAMEFFGTQYLVPGYTRVMDPGFSQGGCTNYQIGIILQFLLLKTA